MLTPNFLSLSLSGEYCCYDVFSGCDVRCHVKIPGGFMARAVTGGGVDVEVDEDIWKGAILSSFMRTTMLHPNLLVGVEVPNLAVLPSHERFPFSLQERESFLLLGGALRNFQCCNEIC